MKHLPLPVSINALLNGKSVEWERIEYKEGWDPAAVLRTICAFANDFHNLGGGYIIIGVTEKNGRPVLPPKGIPPKDLDKIQKNLLKLGHSAIRPMYHPVTFPYVLKGKHVLIIWVPGGETRPYQCRKSLARGKNEWGFYIRKQSSTVQATQPDEKELLRIAATVPFDDRYNQTASLDDLSPRLIEEFLKKVGSDLSAEAAGMSIEDLGRRMNIIGGPPESPFPKNVGLMFFNEHPERFFPVTQIDVVWFPDGAGGDVFEEKEFKGPLDRIVGDALSHIERKYLVETVIKHPHRAEAERVWNYPYAALEEAVVNAVYHRSYEEREPIEIRVSPDEIVILSYPGADRSVQMGDLATGKVASRRYRNRRIGEFLKELDLTEGRSTGMLKILRAVKRNGSPEPKFETDEDRSYFIVRFPVHEKSLKTPKESGAQNALPPAIPANISAIVPAGQVSGQAEQVSDQAEQVSGQVKKQVTLPPAIPPTVPAGQVKRQSEQVSEQVEQVSGQAEQVSGQVEKQAAQILELLSVFEDQALKRSEIQNSFRSVSRGSLARHYLQPALANGLIEMTAPDSPQSPQQRYRITDKGRQVLEEAKSKAAK